MHRQVYRFLSAAIVGMCLAVGTFVVPSAYAYVLEPWRWTSFPIYYKWGANLSGTTLSATQQAWKTAFQTADNDWYNSPSPAYFAYSSTATTELNTYSAADNLAGYNDTSYYTSTGQAVKCLTFGNTYSGKSTTANQRRSTANHEMGHCIGLGHSSATWSVMRTGRDRDTIFTPQQDDVDGVNAKYPN